MTGALEAAIALAVKALGQSGDQNGTGSRAIPAGDLEVAVLDRSRSQQRKFRRLDGDSLSGMLADA